MLGDYTLWVEQFMEEMSALARKNWRLKQKLKDPNRSKGRRRALQRRKQQEEQLAQYACDIATLEAWCHRYWKALPRSVRGKYGMDWGTPPEGKSLVGQAWRYIATKYRWPDGYIITSQHFRGIPHGLQQEIIKSGITDEGIHLGKPHEWDTPEEEVRDYHNHRAYTYHGETSRYAKWYSALSVPNEAREPNALSLAGRPKEGSEESS